MSNIPDDISSILTEIDAALKAKGVPPTGRPLLAVREFCKRYKVPMPLMGGNLNDTPAELQKNAEYTSKIHSWYKDLYGKKSDFDPSERAKIAIYADGDIWECRLPLLLGGVLIAPSPKISKEQPASRRRKGICNPFEHLTDLTQSRLDQFSNDSKNEVLEMFGFGLSVRDVFSRMRHQDMHFSRAETDWSAATMHLAGQRADFGQSLYSSYQMVEKFMKGLVKVGGPRRPKQVHELKGVLNQLEGLGMSTDLVRSLLCKLPYKSSARYDYASSLTEAYEAHRASLMVVSRLGSLKLRSGANK